MPQQKHRIRDAGPSGTVFAALPQEFRRALADSASAFALATAGALLNERARPALLRADGTANSGFSV
jgi:hypothetical protein